MKKVRLCHYEDTEAVSSMKHRISLSDMTEVFPDEAVKLKVFGTDIFQLKAYGRTEEEALSDFKNKVNYLMEELNEIRSKLRQDKIRVIEVDAKGVEI